ncbi:MAG: RsbRD N-terminal domain-containing protein [Dehalococcoidia bacterium]
MCSVLQRQGAAILERWLEAVTLQWFHAGHREHAIADHIPKLYDAPLSYLQNAVPQHAHPGTPLDDDAILTTARQHAQARLGQGLEPIDVVTEFGLLRQDILEVLRQELPDTVPAGDVLAAGRSHIIVIVDEY